VARLKPGVYLTSREFLAGELPIDHPALLDPTAPLDGPPPPNERERALVDIVGCDGARRAGSAAPMAPRHCFWQHWLPRLAAQPSERSGAAAVGAKAAEDLPLHLEHAQVADRPVPDRPGTASAWLAGHSLARPDWWSASTRAQVTGSLSFSARRPRTSALGRNGAPARCVYAAPIPHGLRESTPVERERHPSSQCSCKPVTASVWHV